MTAKIAILFSALISLNLYASVNPDFTSKYHATDIALKFSQIKTAQDIPIFLPIGEENRAQFINELNRLKIKKFILPHVTMPSATEVKFESAGDSLKFDFREFSAGYIYVGSSKVNLKSKISFADWQSIVEGVLHPRSASFIFPEANATQPSVFGSFMSAVGITVAQKSRELV